MSVDSMAPASGWRTATMSYMRAYPRRPIGVVPWCPLNKSVPWRWHEGRPRCRLCTRPATKSASCAPPSALINGTSLFQLALSDRRASARAQHRTAHCWLGVPGKSRWCRSYALLGEGVGRTDGSADGFLVGLPVQALGVSHGILRTARPRTG
jgi:hypothetical protein